MVMILKGSDRAKSPDYFDRMFRLRHRVFVIGRGWSLPSRNSREIDEYDDDDAVYFLDINDDEVIEGSVRITPTEQSSLLADYYPHIIENGDAPRSPHICEATRYIVLPVQKNRDSIRLGKARLIGAVIEWCLDKKLSFIQTVIDTATLSSYVEMTLQTKLLGLSHPYGGGLSAPGGGECIAIRWPITDQVLNDVYQYGDLNGIRNAPLAHTASAEVSPGFIH